MNRRRQETDRNG
jgi:hypothetical protein